MILPYSNLGHQCIVIYLTCIDCRNNQSKHKQNQCLLILDIYIQYMKGLFSSDKQNFNLKNAKTKEYPIH